MEAKELMKYDWVMNDRIGVCQVIGLPREVKDYPIEITVMYPAEGFTEIRNIGEHYIQPVELTPEIMGKNCTLIEREYKFGEYPNILSIMYDSSDRIRIMEGDCEYYGIEIKYVHELQHALRLAGIKKEIVL